MLIRAFQIQVRRRAQLLALVQHAIMGDTGVKPDVQRISDLAVLVRVVTQQLRRLQIKPGINAGFLHPLGDLFDQCRGLRMQLAGFPVHEQGDRHTPGTLTGNTPVGPIGQHAFDARLAPLGQPLHLIDFLTGTGQQARLIHGHKPLRRRTENQRRFMTPAMRVAVFNFRQLDQIAAVFQRLDHRLVGLAHMQATHHRQIIAEQAVIQHRADRVQVVLLAYHKVVGTMARGGVYQAGTRVGGDVLTEDDRHLGLQEGMLQSHHFQLAACDGRRTGHIVQPPARHQIIGQRLSHQQLTGHTIQLAGQQYIIQLRVHCHRPVGRQSPGGGGPDHQRRGAGFNA